MSNNRNFSNQNNNMNMNRGKQMRSSLQQQQQQQTIPPNQPPQQQQHHIGPYGGAIDPQQQQQQQHYGQLPPSAQQQQHYQHPYQQQQPPPQPIQQQQQPYGQYQQQQQQHYQQQQHHHHHGGSSSSQVRGGPSIQQPHGRQPQLPPSSFQQQQQQPYHHPSQQQQQQQHVTTMGSTTNKPSYHHHMQSQHHHHHPHHQPPHHQPGLQPHPSHPSHQQHQQHQQQQNQQQHQPQQQQQQQQQHSNFKRVNQSNNQQPSQQRSVKMKKLDFEGIQVEELNDFLGFPDLYQLETNAKYHDGSVDVPELTLNSEYAKMGYVETGFKRSKTVPYGSFVHAKGSNFIKFITHLRAHESTLRTDWKTYQTRRMREDRKMLLDSAVKACQCETPKVPFPEPSQPSSVSSSLSSSLSSCDSLSEDGVHQWMDELANLDINQSFTPLRQLAHRIPNCIQTKDILPLLCKYQVPYVRAVWFVKIHFVHQQQTKSIIDMTQLWTETIRTFLSEQVDSGQDLNTTFNEIHVKYVIHLIAWCDEERLMDMAMIEDWFLSKCCEAISTPLSSSSPLSPSPSSSSSLNDHHHHHQQQHVGSRFNYGSTTSITITHSSSSSPSSSSSSSSYASIRSRAMRVNFDAIFSLSVDMRNQYYRALDQLANLVYNSAQCSTQLRFSLLSFIKILRKQTNASKFFTSIFQIVDQSTSVKIADPAYHVKLFTIKSFDKFAKSGSFERLYTSILKRGDINLIPTICEWGYSVHRSGKFRRYIVSSILHKLLTERPELYSPVQNILFRVIDEFAMTDETATRNLLYLLADFVRSEIFSFESYIDEVVSRGHNTDVNSNHRKVLLQLPLAENASTYLRLRRKISLYGACFSRNEQSRSEDNEIQSEHEQLLQHIIQERSEESDQLFSNFLDGANQKLSVFTVFNLCDRLFTYMKQTIDSNDPSLISYDILAKVVLAIVTLGEYRKFADLIKYILEHNMKLGAYSVWISFESVLCRIVLNYLPAFVAMDQAQLVSKVLLTQCRKESRQGMIEARRRKLIEEYLKYLHSTFPEVFKIDIFKRDFPHLSMFLDGLTTSLNSSPTFVNAADNSDDLVSTSPQTSPHSQSSLSRLFIDGMGILIRNTKQVSPQNITQMVEAFIEEHHSNVSLTIFGTKDDIRPLIDFCIENFDPRTPTVVHILREMMSNGCFFTSMDMYDTLSQFISSKLMQNGQDMSQVRKILEFLISSVALNFLSYEVLTNHIMKNVFHQVPRKIHQIDDANSSESAKICACLIIWYAFVILCGEMDVSTLDCPKYSNLMASCGMNANNLRMSVPVLERHMFLQAKYNCPVSYVPNCIRMLGKFCRATQKQDSFSLLIPEVVLEVFGNFISQTDVLYRVACRSGILYRCFEVIYDQIPSTLIPGNADLSYRQVAICSILRHSLSVFNPDVAKHITGELLPYFVMPQPNSPDVTLPAVSDMITLMKKMGNDDKWTYWHGSFFAHSFIFHMKRKTKVESERLNREIYEPLIVSKTTNATVEDSRFRQVYSYILLHLAEHFPKLKSSICDYFFTLLKIQLCASGTTMADDEQCLHKFSGMKPIMIELCRLDANISEKTFHTMTDAVKQLIKQATSIPLFMNRKDLSGIYGVQLKLVACFRMIHTLLGTCFLFNNTALKPRPASSVRTGVTKSILECVFALLDHKISQVSYQQVSHGSSSSASSQEETTVSSISHALRRLLLELQEKVAELQIDDQHKVSEQLNSYCTARINASPYTSKVSSVLSPPIMMNATARKTRHNLETWWVLEDLTSNCTSCHSVHGNITPFLFNGKIQERKTAHIYGGVTNKDTTQGLVMKVDPTTRR